MQIEQTILERIRALPEDKQQEVLDFVEFLHHKAKSGPTRRSLKGIWADLNIELTEEDVAEVRREMWGNFPRDIER